MVLKVVHCRIAFLTSITNVFSLGPTAFANGPTIVELQGDWIVKAIDYIVKNNHRTMDPTAESEALWTKHVAELCDETLFPGTDSWYMG